MSATEKPLARGVESFDDDHEAAPFASGIVTVPRVDDRIADHAFALAVRLIRGERFDLVDQHGRWWTASATTLALVGADGGITTPVVTGSAADVAIDVIWRGLRVRPVVPGR
jgi:hypothetical protein